MAEENHLEIVNRLRNLEDRSAIVELVNRYADGVRLGDAELITSCFSDDASIDYGHGRVMQGRQRISAYFSELLGPTSEEAPLAFDLRLASTPVVSNVEIELEGDAAHCESACLAIHAGRRHERDFVVVRGTRNVDELVRTADGWKIRRRVHSSAWSFEVGGAVDEHEAGSTSS